MQIHVVDSFFGFVKVRFVTMFALHKKSERYQAAQRAAAADGPGPDPDPGPGPEIFQLSGRPRFAEHPRGLGWAPYSARSPKIP